MTPEPGPSLAIETHALTKLFGRHAAVNSVDLAVPSGSVFGFLGPNGSGKTTTIRMLLGLSSPSSGSVTVLGSEMPGALARVLPRIGALVEGPAFYPFLSGEANLRRLDTANRWAPSKTRNDRVDRALQRVGLAPAATKRVQNYSLGMKQRLGIANALLMPRELLVLDEPTNGLDPQGTREVRTLIRSLADDGATVFVSSHLLAEIEQVCTHAAVMSGGRLVAQATIAELRSEGAVRLRVTTPDRDAASAVLTGLGLEVGAASGSLEVGAASGSLEVVTASLAPTTLPEDVVAALVAAKVRVRGFEVIEQSLEDRFVQLTGEGFEVVQ